MGVRDERCELVAGLRGPDRGRERGDEAADDT
jgi:hypothetical protein